MVKIILSIDNRETEFINLYNKNKEHINENIEVKFDNLAIGDFYIFINDKLEYIIERKTIADLDSSIADGRYKEQKARLKEYSDKCRPFYIIENYRSARDMVEFRGYDTTIQRVFGAILSIALPDNFPTFYTKNIDDTYYLIFSFLSKIQSNPTKFTGTGLNNNIQVSQHSSITTPSKTDIMVENLILKERSANINSSNIVVLMLAQIPAISVISAMAISEAHNHSLGTLIDKLRELPNEQARKDYITNIKSNNRRLGKRIGENVVSFLKLE